jgi:hypothetical protein
MDGNASRKLDSLSRGNRKIKNGCVGVQSLDLILFIWMFSLHFVQYAVSISCPLAMSMAKGLVSSWRRRITSWWEIERRGYHLRCTNCV